MKERILIADDEESIRLTFSEFLYSAGYKVDTAKSLSACIEKMQSETFDLLFLDVMFGRENGIEAIQSLKDLQPECKIVVITGNPRLQSLVEAKKVGAVDYLTKPLREASLLYNVKKVLDH
jgi:DNA-binding NtrC family response regulator